MVSNTKYLVIVVVLIASTIFLSACDIFSGSPELSSIKIEKDSVSQYYVLDEQPDFSSIEVTATYSDRTSKALYYDDLEEIILDTSQIGESELIVSYKGETDSIFVNILSEEDSVKEMSLKEDTLDAEVLQYESLDYSNIKINITYMDDSVETVTIDDINVSSFDTKTPGKKDLVINYKGAVLNIEIYVAEIISYNPINNTLPNQVEIDSEVTFNELEIELTYSNNASKILTYSDLNISDFSTAEYGEKTLEISYKEFDMSFEIYVTDSDLIEIYVEKDSLETTYMLGEEINYENFEIWAVYPEEEIKLSHENVDFSSIDNSKRGEQVLDIEYRGKSTSIDFYFYYEIIAFDSPDFVEDYLFNIDERENKETEFIKRDDHYYVGSNNEFEFLPFAVGGSSKLDDLSILDEFEMSIDISKLENGDWINLSDENKLDDYVQIDYLKGLFNFDSNAEGEIFKIEVAPTYFENYTPIKFKFKVIDAWNAYDVIDLSRLDRNTDGAWDDYKAQHGIEDIDINGLVLHNDMNITADDIPKDYIHQSGDYEGSLKDWRSIYTLITDPGTRFDFIGNYFTIDASKIPLIEDGKNDGAGGDGIIAHSTLFGMAGDDDNLEDDVFIGEVHVKNMSLRGNAPRHEDLKYSGGITLFRSSAEKFVMENTITREALTIFTPLGQWEDTGDEYMELKNEVLLKNNRGYDSFSVMLYLWKSDVVIENSYYERSGGPVAIATHRNRNGDNDYDQYSSLKTINTVMKTNVSGEEAWFQLNGAAPLATDLSVAAEGLSDYASGLEDYIKQMIDGFDGFESTSLKSPDTNLMNLKAVIMESNLGTQNYINGSIAINNLDNPEKNNVILDKSSDDMKDVFSKVSSEHLVFQNSNGGIISLILDEEDGPIFEFYDHEAGEFKSDEQLINEERLDILIQAFSGDNMYIFAPGYSYETRLGIVLEYYN